MYGQTGSGKTYTTLGQIGEVITSFTEGINLENNEND